MIFDIRGANHILLVESKIVDINITNETVRFYLLIVLLSFTISKGVGSFRGKNLLKIVGVHDESCTFDTIELKVVNYIQNLGW